MKRRKNPQIPEEQDYDYESLREDRKYGLYWFSGLWKILRPVLIGLCALLIVFGVLSTVNLAIGQVTPPVGVNLFVAIGVADKLQGLKDKTKVTIASMSKAVWPMILACVITLLVVTYVPFFSTVFLKG